MSNSPAFTADTVFIATYVEATPDNAGAAREGLRQMRDVNRADAGNIRCDLLQRLAQENHFVILEAWQSEAHWTAHGAGSPDNRLQELLLSPDDIRSHSGFAVGPAGQPTAGTMPDSTLYVVTHVDVVPPHKDEGVDLLAQLVAASRPEDGNLGFEVWQQIGRLNHLTVVEAWRDQAAFDAHSMAAPARGFRETLAPLSGALYDQRLFRAVR